MRNAIHKHGKSLIFTAVIATAFGVTMPVIAHDLENEHVNTNHNGSGIHLYGRPRNPYVTGISDRYIGTGYNCRKSASRNYRIGVSFLEKGNYAKAENYLNCSLIKRANNHNTIYVLALVNIEKDEKGIAQTYLEEAITLKPDFILAHRELGLVHAKNGNTIKAQEQLSWLDRQITFCDQNCPSASALTNGRDEIVKTIANENV